MSNEGSDDTRVDKRFVDHRPIRDHRAVVHLPREMARMESVKRIREAVGHADHSLQRITRLMSHALAHPAAALVLFGDDQAQVLCAYGLTEAEMVAVGAMAIWRQVVASNKILLVADACTDPQFLSGQDPRLPAWRSFAVAPIRAPNGIAVGGIAALDRDPRELTLQQELLLRDFRDTAEELIRLRRELLHDPITDVWGQRYVDAMLREEWQSTYAYLRPVTLMRIRVEPAGAPDRLRAIADFLSGSFRRSSDIVGGYGDHEFIALLPETNRQGAEVLGKWLSSSVGEAIREEGIRVSVGAAVATTDADFQAGPQQLLHLAESALADARGQVGSAFTIRGGDA